MTGVERNRLRRAKLRADGKCMCGATLFPEWGMTCPECKEIQNRRGRKHSRSAKGRANRARWKRERYAANTAAILEAQRAKRLALKVAGICQMCIAPAMDESLYCPSHHERHLKSARESMARLVARRREEARAA